jgi:hypothetical protein
MCTGVINWQSYFISICLLCVERKVTPVRARGYITFLKVISLKLKLKLKLRGSQGRRYGCGAGGWLDRR